MDYQSLVETLDELMDVSLRTSSSLLMEKHNKTPMTPLEKNSISVKIIQCMHVLQMNM